MATAQQQREKEAEAYRDGYRAGYAKGVEDGRGMGYSDAKLRAWLAVDAIPLSALIPSTRKHVHDALANVLGRRS